jgi:uncharacterized protein YbjT (DUF2867 family)
LGQHVVLGLIDIGCTVRIMSRRTRPANVRPNVEWAQADLETGQGLRDAVADVATIVHAASNPQAHTWQTDVEGTRQLVAVARSAQVEHLVYISIVGIERIPYAYYRSKLAAEDAITGGSVPWSILRATQFHNLIDQVISTAARFPIVPLPTDWQLQPIDASEVAEALVRCVTAGPAGRLPDMGGPQVLRGGELARMWLESRQLKRLVVPLPLPGKVSQSIRRGYNTCPQHRQGQITWAQWLQRKYGVNAAHSAVNPPMSHESVR